MKKIYAIIGMIVILSLFTINVLGLNLGVSPGHTTINFEPNLERSITINVHNSEDDKLVADISIDATEEEKRWISIDEKSFEVAPNSVKPITVKIKLPETIPIGKHRIELMVRVRPPGTEEGGMAAGVTGAVLHPIYVIKPSYGKYMELFALSMSDVFEGEEARATMSVESLGEEGSIARGYVEIFDVYGTKITTLITEEKRIAAIAKAEFTAKWDTSLAEPGDYVAVGYVEYDGEKTNELSQNFSVRGMYGKITKLEVYKNEKVDFSITFKNYYIENVDFEVLLLIKDIDGREIGRLTSGPQSAPALGEKIVHLYWEPKEGEYIAEVTASYAGKTTDVVEKQFTIENEIGRGYLLPAAIIVIVVVVMALAIILFARRRRKGKEKSRSEILRNLDVRFAKGEISEETYKELKEKYEHEKE